MALLPADLLDYDLVAFVDSDVAINPSAPCLSQLATDIPLEGFAAVQAVAGGAISPLPVVESLLTTTSAAAASPARSSSPTST